MKKEFVYQKLTPLSVILYCVGAFRLHADGTSFNVVFRWYNPVNWIMLLILIPFCAFAGAKLSNEMPFKIPDFWEKNRDQLQWVSPWTRLNSIKPFRFNKTV